MKYLIRKVGFFLMLGSSLGLFVFSKFSPISFYLIFAGTLLVTILLERLLPYEKHWNNSNDTKQDVFYAIISVLVGPISKVLATYVVVNLGLSLPSFNYWSIQQVWILVLLGLMISGFLPYWYHRLSHTQSAFLWKIHAVHHSPEKVYWLNGLRFHPINTFLNSFLSLFPLLLIGFPKDIVLVVGFINNYVSVLNHANIDFQPGIFNYVFNTNAVHRWHHSKKIEEGNNNYSGGALIIWDLIFGTFFYSKRKISASELGLFAESKAIFPYQSLKKQMCFAFCKSRLWICAKNS